MNLGGHIAVAAAASDDPVFWLGSALPDLAAIGRFRLLGDTDNQALSAGIAFHHRTDTAFHRHEWFTTIQRDLHDQLISAGLRRGAARAVGHVGPELLLDGALSSVAHRQHRAIEIIGVVADDAMPLVVADQRQAWSDHLQRIRELGMPTDYDDPAAVARRLHRMLRSRPRLTFDEKQTLPVAELLAGLQPHIVSTAPALVAELESELT